MPSRFQPNRRALLTAAGVAAASACMAQPATARAAPGFVGIDGWINSGPLTMGGLRGRPVLVNFWARSCINCINAMPYIKSWYAKYSDRGFVVIGVHTPEFSVEKSHPALEAAVSRFGLTYPIAEDNASATWNAWGNQFWPAEYLVDQRGNIVHLHVGEGGYRETEQLIQHLVA